MLSSRRPRKEQRAPTRRNRASSSPICPGIILSDNVSPVPEKNPHAFQVLLDGIPIGHLGEPNDSTQAALYLASEDARHVTGTEIAVDGGYTAR
ncbi:SDR family oxidoreductase [Rhodococcus opacus]|uniref:SDR family oxidoreductase n=1 Tax=Rhodococcus opacus TaxID=37919 RepID=UPI0022360CB0|nr:SDR family oxidoreductase [Rhodococcus opacus]UZG59911.1 SDR family oxidoreductase [Rhodococcus opacus]